MLMQQQQLMQQQNAPPAMVPTNMGQSNNMGNMTGNMGMASSGSGQVSQMVPTDVFSVQTTNDTNQVTSLGFRGLRVQG